MRWGMINSTVLHLSVLLLSLGVLPHFLSDPETMTPVLPVELLTIDEVTNVKPLEKADEPKPEEIKPAEPEPEPEPVREVAAPTPPTPEAAPQPEPPPPVPEPVKEAAPEPMPVPAEDAPAPKEEKIETASVAPRLKPMPPAPTKKKEDKLDQLQALLNKIPPKETSETVADEKTVASAEVQTQAAGAQTALTVDEMAAFQAKMLQCWTVPSGAIDAADLVVKVRVWLNPDGSLGRAPEIVAQASGQFAQVAAEAAMRAIRLCAPYNFLPVDKYSTWRELSFRFDPRPMFGG